ncbi:MAG: hypothetical protein LW688_03170 [Cryomorphaceae bacterium]|nr:hypothetical protein [Cryomorphaceae bacterium]
MKAILFILFNAHVLFFYQNVFAQNYSDSMNALEIVRALPQKKYLSTTTNIYTPKMFDASTNLDALRVTEAYLSKKYGCYVGFFEEGETEGANDPIFEVTPSDWESFGTLYLHLSVLEEFYQRGILREQVRDYARFTDKFFYSVSSLDTANNDSLMTYINYSDVSNILFAPCDSMIDNHIYEYFIPLSSDTEGIELFSKRIHDLYSMDEYEVFVLGYNQNSEYLSNVYTEVGNGLDSVIIPLCGLERTRQAGKLQKELSKVFAIND